VLAFPVKHDSGIWKPDPKDLPTFAYLPLGYFNFWVSRLYSHLDVASNPSQFIIQADFLTTANRQSIDEDSPWNKNIAMAIPQAFVEAIHKFNQMFGDQEELGRTWPLFLNPKNYPSGQYWRDIEQSILNRLMENRVIKTRAGNYATPRSLMFLDWAHDSTGDPIFGATSDYISSSYPSSARPALELLKVGSPSSDWLLKHLRDLDHKGRLHTKSRTMEWYSDLAKVILKPSDGLKRNHYHWCLKSIPLIPVGPDQWVTAPTPDKPIYFPEISGVNIPPGLQLTMVQQAACKWPHRKRLFKYLGVGNCNVRSIVEEIIKHHSTFETAVRSDIISQVEYLYHVKQELQPNEMKEMRFAVEGGPGIHKGRFIYSSTSADDELRALFSDCDYAVFLHRDYFCNRNASQKIVFINWLEAEAGISTTPRLCSKSLGLHKDFLWLLENKIDKILSVLYKYWDIYEPQLSEGIVKQLSRYRFLCLSGQHIHLYETYLPMQNLLEKCKEYFGIPNCDFLTLPDNSPTEWTFLSKFNVGTKQNLDFYIWIFRQPQYKMNTNVTRAKKLYSDIQSATGSKIQWSKVR
jgi:hypothetical protein